MVSQLLNKLSAFNGTLGFIVVVKTVTMVMMTYVTSDHNLLIRLVFRPLSTLLRRVKKI
jgi:hypothetical protein